MTKAKTACVFAALCLAVLLCAGAAASAWAVEDGAASGSANSGSANSGNVSTGNSGAPANAPSNTQLDLGEDNLVNTQQMPDSSFIYDTSIADLSTADSYMEGQTVQVVGEAVGDRIQAELDMDYSWLVLADAEGNTVSVYLPADLTKLVDTYGRYGSMGTTLQVRGTFHLVCREHQGQTDIHADYAGAMARGKVNRPAFNFVSFIPGLLLLTAGLLMVALLRILRNRMR